MDPAQEAVWIKDALKEGNPGPAPRIPGRRLCAGLLWRDICHDSDRQRYENLYGRLMCGHHARASAPPLPQGLVADYI